MKTFTLKKMFMLTVLLGLFYAEVNFVMGVQGASISPGASSRANFSDTNGALYTAQAGNVTQIDIAGNSITTHWAGFFGNVSGNVTLQDSSGYKFYDWTGLGLAGGEVFAANQSTVDWTGIGCANATEITNINAFLGATPTDADRVETTYIYNAHPNVTIGSVTILNDTCNTTNAYSNGAYNSSLYKQLLLTDTIGIPVFTTLINDSATGFNSGQWDFELLAGAKDSGVTPLYFYIELG